MASVFVTTANGRRFYDNDFKRLAVLKVMYEGKSVPDVARELGVAYTTVWNWVHGK